MRKIDQMLWSAHFVMMQCLIGLRPYYTVGRMMICVVVLPSFFFMSGEITQVGVFWCRGDIQERRYISNSRSPLSEPDTIVKVHSLHLIVGEITQERRCKVVLSFSPLWTGFLCGYLCCVSRRGDYTGEENYNTLVLPLWTKIVVILWAFILTTFLCIFWVPLFYHVYRLWCGRHSGHAHTICIYIV